VAAGGGGDGDSEACSRSVGSGCRRGARTGPREYNSRISNPRGTAAGVIARSRATGVAALSAAAAPSGSAPAGRPACARGDGADAEKSPRRGRGMG
jgi:hypothetical protein